MANNLQIVKRILHLRNIKQYVKKEKFEKICDLLEWFTHEYPEHCSTELDMGKSCSRFKNMAKIPYELVAELCTKMTPHDWMRRYQDAWS